MKLLIIEDEQDILRALVNGFQKRGYIVTGVADGEEGLELAQVGNYDLIVLDLNLPGMDGIDILKEIRNSDKMQKILILSARTDYAERVVGLDLGANDYLVKPFDFGELEARVRGLLRRNFVQHDVVLQCGKLRVDTASHRVYTQEETPIELSPKEYGILEYLLLKRGTAVPAEELIEHLWMEDEGLFSNAVKVHISQLRKKLLPYVGEDFITNRRGAGYLIER